MIKMVVFDMAGTTVNEHNLVYRTLQRTIAGAGYPVELEKVLLWGAGKEKLQAIRDIVTEYTGEPIDDDLAMLMHHAFLSKLDRAYTHAEVDGFADCEPLFGRLRERNIKVVLNTGYNRKTADQLLAKIGWEEGREIDLSVTADEVSNSRPHPDMILLAMDELGIEDATMVAKVGDSIIDIEEGKSAGCGLTFGVTTGAHSREQLASAKPDHILDSLGELNAWV